MSEQKLLQIHRQISELAQKQDNCNSSLGLMLSSAESFSNRFGINKNPKMFESYNLFHSGDLKNENDLKSQLTLHIKIFRNLVNHEKLKGRNYIFPENLGPEEIRKLVTMWKNNVKKQDQIYYDNILSILDENFNINFPNLPKNSSYHKSNQGIDPNYFMDIVPNVMGCIDYRSNQIGKEAERTGVIKNQIMMGSNECFNPQLNNLKFTPMNQGLNKNEKEKKIMMDALNKISQYSECYYYLYCKKFQINADLNSKYERIDNYLNYNFEDIEKEANSYLNEFKKIIDKYFDYNRDFEISNEYYKSFCKWYSETKAQYFLYTKKLFEDAFKGI